MLTKMNLSQEEIQRLSYERFHYPCVKTQKKLHAVYLKAFCGYSNPVIGKILSIHYNTVARYIKTYREKGIEGLYSNHYQGKESQLEVYKALIIEDFNKNPVCSIAQAAARIKALTGIERKPTQVRAFMRRHGFKYRKLAAVPGKLNPEKQKQFLEETLEPAIEKAQKGEVELLFCDAAHFTLSAFLCMVWSQVRTFLRTSHGRNRINVLGAINAITKEVITLINTTYITAETIMDFLCQLKEKYSDKPIFLVLDNAKYQHCRAVMEKADELGITLLFLPPYSPNLNIIERLWKFTKKQILYAKYYDTPDKFHDAVKDFFDTVNDKCYDNLVKLMSLNFQLFEQEHNSLNCAA
jgi:transposase